jgi:hypothetical protein
MPNHFFRYFAIAAAALTAGCQSSTTYQLVRVDKDAFSEDYAECSRLQAQYLFSYERNPFDPITPLEKCMRDRGYALERPK